MKRRLEEIAVAVCLSAAGLTWVALKRICPCGGCR